jgi:hypothetical protein
MSVSHIAFERRGRSKSTRAVWIFAGKVLLALALVLTATFALVETELGLVKADQVSDADLRLMLSLP